MIVEKFVNQIEFVIAVAFLLWFFYGPWQQLVVDTARQKLFEIRDSVFLLAADGELEFNSSLYGQLREQMNGILRFCHRMTWYEFLTFMVVERRFRGKRIDSDQEDLLEVIQRIPDKDTRSALVLKYLRLIATLVLSVYLRSPLLILISVVLSPLIGLFILYSLIDSNQGRRESKLLSLGKAIDRERLATSELQPAH